MRVRNWLKTVPALVIIGSILFLVLTIGGGLLLWGSNFANNMVHNQLSEQKISFPPKGPALDAKEFPGLQKYAGQAVDNGPKAKAYADQFIKAHLKEVHNGMTYSEVSALSRANPDDQKLAGEVQTLFRGETLRESASDAVARLPHLERHLRRGRDRASRMKMNEDLPIVAYHHGMRGHSHVRLQRRGRSL